MDFLKPWIKNEIEINIEGMKPLIEVCTKYEFIELNWCLL